MRRVLPVPANKTIEYADELAMGMMQLMGYSVDKDKFNLYHVADLDGAMDSTAFGSEKAAWAALWEYLKERT